MAIQDENVKQQQTGTKQDNVSGTAKWSLHGAGLFGAPISRGIGSEFYNKLKDNLVNVYKTANENVETAIIDLDKINEPSLAFSAIVVAMRYKNSPALGVAYHILVLEATGDKLTPQMTNINNQQVEILKVTSDALDDVLISKATERVKKAFPTGPWYMVDGCVVPEKFNPDDQYAVHRLALNAGLATGTELELHDPAFADLNLAQLQHDSSLAINIGFNRQQIEDAVSAPMRSDALINFASKKIAQTGKIGSVNAGDKEEKISEVSGFVDLLWNPQNPITAFNAYAPQQQMQTQKYAARLVITNLASNFSYTPGSVLLALATALSLRDDNNWIQAFRPMPGSEKEIDIADIGALNIEANLSNDPSGFGKRIDTKSDSFKLEDLGQLISALVQPGLIVSLDCPEVGPQAWYLSVFAAASTGQSNAAYKVIYDAANQLTNGAFGKYFPVSGAIFTDIGNRVHNGVWEDRNGNKRDIRDIDHLAVCNLVGDRNPQFIRDWSDTILRTQYPLPLRLAARKKMIMGLTSETAVITGFSQRVTFTAAFLDALARGIKETGLPVEVNTPLTGSDFTNQRGTAGFAGAALLAPGQSFMTPGGYGYGQTQYNQFNAPNSFRW